MRNVLKSVFSKKVSAAVLTAVMLFVSVFSMSMIASAASFSPRLSAPSLSNKYYYSDLNAFYKYDYGMPNCTAYAYGRAYEILGSEPKLSWNNAEQWYDYNKSNGYYKYGQTPKVGAIACWSYNGGGGHVAVVEKVENGQITFSNSAWSGKRFYLSYASTSDKNAGGNSWWNFQGYIYLGNFSGSTSTTQATTKKVTYTTGTYKTDVDDYLNMRSGAGTSYSYVTSVPGNVTLNVTKVSTAGGYTWGYTSYNGKTGWVALDFVLLFLHQRYSQQQQSLLYSLPQPKPRFSRLLQRQLFSRQQPRLHSLQQLFLLQQYSLLRYRQQQLL